MEECRIFVHIGFHKTGTSSIQLLMDKNRDKMIDVGIFYYTGALNPSNHVELHCAAMRDERVSPFKLRSGIRPNTEFIEATRTQVAKFLQPAGTFIFSAEGLSYLRYSDEIRTLHQLFGGREIEFIAYIRNQSDWLASYKAEMRKHAASPAARGDSYSNTQSNSWLLDFEARLAPFRDVAGTKLHVIDYDMAVANEGSVIPSFFRTIGASSTLDDNPEWKDYWKNARQY